MFLTLNDLSINDTADTKNDAKKHIEDFVLFCKELDAKSIVDEIIFPENLFSMFLHNEYGLTQWLSDDNVSMVHKCFFRRFLDKHRRYYSTSNTDGEFAILFDGQEQSSLGCAFAFEHDHVLLSFPTNEYWTNKLINGKYSVLDESGEICISTQCVNNVWTSLPTEEILSIYIKELSNDIASGQDLWDKREQLYPNLVFCENVKHQLFDDSEKYHIIAVMKKLERFQDYFSNCNNLYDPKVLGMGARTESETVKSDTDLKALRRFKLPDDNEEYFFDHVGFTGKYTGGRIYFIPDNANNRCFIGYIGRHLPTKKY